MSVSLDDKKSIFDEFIESCATAGKLVSIALGNKTFVFRVAADYDALAGMLDKTRRYMAQIHREKHIPEVVKDVVSKRVEVTSAVSFLAQMHVGFNVDDALVAEVWGEKEFYTMAKKSPENFQALKEFIDHFTGPNWSSADATYLEQKKSSSKKTSSSASSI